MAQHHIIIDAVNSVVHCFIYHIDVELKACQLQLLLSTALQRKIISVLLTGLSEYRVRDMVLSVLSPPPARVRETPDNVDHILLQRGLIAINWLITVAKVFPHGS